MLLMKRIQRKIMPILYQNRISTRYHSHCKKAKKGQRKNGEKLDFSGGGFMDVDYF